MASKKYEGLSKEEIKEIKKAKRKRRRKIAGRVWLCILGVFLILFLIFCLFMYACLVPAH